MKKNSVERGISGSESDTYTTREYNGCIAILKEVSAMGVGVEYLFEKLLTTCSKEDIDQTILDLGKESKINHNKKWRNVVGMLRRSFAVVKIISNRPMVLAYKHGKRF